MRRSMKSIAWRFQSTPPARGATTSCDPRFPSRNDFNPRPPRGGRRRQFFLILAAVHFNPRPPRGGRPFCCFCSDFQIDSFQSTPPARGATVQPQEDHEVHGNFNPRPPRGGRLRDSMRCEFCDIFQSTPPARGATSILRSLTILCSLFQSTPPARGATLPHILSPIIKLFQSTPPARGATNMDHYDKRQLDISIHAPREGGDYSCV